MSEFLDNIDTLNKIIKNLREENARVIRENKVAFEAVGGVVKANDKLKEENARLRKALSFYAEENYNGYNGSGACARAAIREGGKDG